MSYVKGLPDNERLHRKIHAEYERGPRIAQLRKLTPVGMVQSLPMYVVDERTPPAVSLKVAHVAMVAQREIEGPAGFDGSGTPNLELCVLSDEMRCVAMVLLGVTWGFWRLAWNDAQPSRIELLDTQPVTQSTPVIGRVWVAAGYRRRGLAQQLVAAVLEHHLLQLDDVAWELPFTLAGERLVRKLAPERFGGSCDGRTMGEVALGHAKGP